MEVLFKIPGQARQLLPLVIFERSFFSRARIYRIYLFGLNFRIFHSSLFMCMVPKSIFLSFSQFFCYFCSRKYGKIASPPHPRAQPLHLGILQWPPLQLFLDPPDWRGQTYLLHQVVQGERRVFQVRKTKMMKYLLFWNWLFWQKRMVQNYRVPEKH